MTPEERELLTKSIKISEENNRMLRSMRRSARFSSFLRLIYWILILASAYGVYYFIQPYVNAMVQSYMAMQKGVETVTNVSKSLPTLPPLPSWLGGPSTTK